MPDYRRVYQPGGKFFTLVTAERRPLDYVHFNPVKHGYVTRPVDWPYSSIHRFIRREELRVTSGCDGAAASGSRVDAEFLE